MKIIKVSDTGLIKAVVIFFLVIIGGFKYGYSQSGAVLLNNHSEIIPFKNLAQRRIASINMGAAYSLEFDAMLRNYASIRSIDFSSIKDKNELKAFNTLIIQLTPQTLFLPETINFILETQKDKEVIIAGFGNTSALAGLDSVSSPLIWNSLETPNSAEQTAKIIFGGAAAEGKLSLDISSRYLKDAGFSTRKTRLNYLNLQELQQSSAKLTKIDDIVNEAIRMHATPSAVVMVVKDGNVIFNKAYGSHTYDGEIPTKVDDIYDLASVTKVAATTMAAMKLYEQQKLDLNAGIGTYLEDVRNSNKNNIPVKDVMLHQAGFVNLDFFSYLKPQDHSADSSWLYSVKLADHYYLRNNYYHEVMWQKMLKTPLPTRGEYVYSDISMFMMKEIIEKQTQMPLDQYVSQEFYSSLGMKTAGFNPIKNFDIKQIVPTERDTYFRKTLLQGYVHDSGASMANGVAGHAGLFSSANDMAILNQMLLNGGTYGGVEYFKPETVSLFTSSQSQVSRRGLGFDRGNGTGYPSSLASPDSFGHTGYTGTAVWVDPRENLVYIFLSNRVYPSATNKLNSMRIRPRIQDAIYEALNQEKGHTASVGY
ncbi:serine hydrolase domain-containing protein [Daejeonella oryzae]|uniref:serine hydrolase domain-containing protein n=1 Tax=Daejeonella oryzae TaxID=1122943 RepID=UPI00040E14C1|nr:serine hydrolase [Daejeonella oryzae]